jgi:hypothetical protein
MYTALPLVVEVKNLLNIASYFIVMKATDRENRNC